MSNKNSGLTRRAFIGGGGAIAAGTLAATIAPATASAEPLTGPWPIPLLDPDKVRDKGCDGYWVNDPYKKTNYGCAYGVASALLYYIKDGLAPGAALDAWSTLPLEMFKWGKTGAVESGTLCGALCGALPIFALASPTDEVEMGTDLLRWYQETALPSTEMDGLPKNLPYPMQAQSVSGSPLCHISVSNWCKASGKTSSSLDRKTRCGKITGDVAKMAAIILNRVAGGKKYVQIYPGLSPAYAECVHCHIDAPPPPSPDAVRLTNSLGQNSACRTCHPDSQPVMSKK